MPHNLDVMPEDGMNMKACMLVFNLVALFLASCSETSTANYPTYQDAIKSGAVEQGWIPAFIPSTAKEIYEQHNIDTNDVWLRFTLHSSDKDRLIKNLKLLTYTEILKIRASHPAKSKWWFEGLIQQSPANDNALNAEVYLAKCNNDLNGYMAFDRTSEQVYYWCSTK